ncbi:hypothetical protein CK203_091766 [Vitis vinifera]|uniref:Uncharacterized protein n=1 Tax=Vitis vinifera TaxID=29760 RepID=A0A438EJ70_VITVI|nr:hypothetical protein CK203_091766 [Vitis vinifera]
MMWSNTLTTSSTISLPLRLRSTFHQLLNMVARATWFDGSHCYKVFRKWSRTHSVFSSETPSKKERLEFGNQRLNRFQQLDLMAGVSAAEGAIFRRSRSAIFDAVLGLQWQEWRNRGCTPMDAARPNCGDDHIATGKDAARPVGRGMHGAVGDEAVHG